MNHNHQKEGQLRTYCYHQESLTTTDSITNFTLATSNIARCRRSRRHCLFWLAQSPKGSRTSWRKAGRAWGRGPSGAWTYNWRLAGTPCPVLRRLPGSRIPSWRSSAPRRTCAHWVGCLQQWVWGTASSAKQEDPSTRKIDPKRWRVTPSPSALQASRWRTVAWEEALVQSRRQNFFQLERCFEHPGIGEHGPWLLRRRVSVSLTMNLLGQQTAAWDV